MTRRTAMAGLLILVVLAFSIACGSSGGGTTATTTQPVTSQPATTPPLGGSFALLEPTGPTFLVIGQELRLRWNAAGYSQNLVIRVALDNDLAPDEVIEWFPMTYGNGSNYLVWDTTGKDVGTYYFLFKIEDDVATSNKIVDNKYSPAVVLTAEAPFTVPPAIQLLSPLTSRTVFPNTPVDVSFKVSNCDESASTIIGIDNDDNYANGVINWLPGSWAGPGNHFHTWDTSQYLPGTYYIVIRATNGNLHTYAYSRAIVIAEHIFFGEPPVVEFQVPLDAILVTSGQIVNTRFSIEDVDSDATGTYILDNDENPDNGFLKVIFEHVLEGVHSYDWNTLGTPPGVFYFFVIASDGYNEVIQYSQPIIVNQLSGRTDPPVITITYPNRALIAPVGTPLDIAGIVTDPDSEAIVQVGIDTDNNFGNGITGWVYSTFSGSFDATWITTYYPAGIYYIVVWASDGVNDVYKYTESIDLKYLMPPGWSVNKLVGVNTSDIFDELDSVGTYHALHSRSSASTRIMHTTNTDGLWSTTTAIHSAYSSPIIGAFDENDAIHLLYNYFGYYIYNMTVGANNSLRISRSAPSSASAKPLYLIPKTNLLDIALVATINPASTSRVSYCERTTGAVLRRDIWTSTDQIATTGVKGYLFIDSAGRKHALFTVINYTQLTTPLYYATTTTNNWGAPVELADLQRPNGAVLEVEMHGDTVHVMYLRGEQLVYTTINGTTVTSEDVFPEPEEGEVLPTLSLARMRVLADTPHFMWRTGTELNHTWYNVDLWATEPVGTVLPAGQLHWLASAAKQYIFTSTTTNFVAFRQTALGWALEPINDREGFLPSAAFALNGDILVAYRTTLGGEKRLNFARRLNTTEQWVNELRSNDCSNFGPIRLLVNSANNIYIRYFTTDHYLSIDTFR